MNLYWIQLQREINGQIKLYKKRDSNKIYCTLIIVIIDLGNKIIK